MVGISSIRFGVVFTKEGIHIYFIEMYSTLENDRMVFIRKLVLGFVILLKLNLMSKV